MLSSVLEMLLLAASVQSEPIQLQVPSEVAVSPIEMTAIRKSENYDNIISICNKMGEEAQFGVDNYFKRFSDKFVKASISLTQTLNYAIYISKFAKEAKSGKKVYANLNEIDAYCYDLEEDCDEGLKELKSKGSIYLNKSVVQSWSDLLTRFKRYCSDIRSQVKEIRNSM